MPSTEIELRPGVLRWARMRADFDEETLASKMGVKPERVLDWEETGRITILQVQKLSRSTYTPEGLLYLDEPWDDRLPIEDLRTPDGQPVWGPSPNLLDTVYLMQERQEWMREERVLEEGEPLRFVRSVAISAAPEEAASGIREVLGVESDWASDRPSWTDALAFLRNRAEQAGVLVFFNGVVGNSTRRKLDREEFQGFALVDEYAPLVFVNAADYKSAQMFTLAHELAHIFVGQEGLSRFEELEPPDRSVEIACNRIAAEFLVAENSLRAFWSSREIGAGSFQAVAREFKVSEVVGARRALDLGLISRDAYFVFYREYAARERNTTADQSGGNFWNTQNIRLGGEFSRAIASAVQESRLLYRDAYRLTGLKGKTFDEFMRRTRERPQ